MRRELARRLGDDIGIVAEPRHQLELARARERREIGLPELRLLAAELAWVARAPLVEYGVDAGVGVLHVVDRVLLRLRAREVDVEHELGFGLARGEEEAHRVAPDLVDQV